MLKYIVKVIFALFVLPFISISFVSRLIFRSWHIGKEEADIFIDWLGK